MMAKKLQMCGTEDEMREVAARICKNYLHGAWKTVDPTSLSFRRISGGLSNFLYYVALPEDSAKLVGYTGRDSSPDAEAAPAPLPAGITRARRSSSFTGEEPTQVLLRIYGQVHGERAMDAIVTESVIFTLLSERRLGPKLHGVFSGGRIEEYIPARCLLVKELSDPSISMKIAEKTAAIHSMAVPLSKEPNWLWKNMAKWLKAVKEEKLSGSYQPKNEEESRIIKELKSIDFDAEIEWLKKYLESVDSISVFCHNDLQEGNILILEDSPLGNLTDDNGSEHEPSAQYMPAFDNDDKFSSDDNNTRDSILSRVSDSGEPRLVLIDFEYCAYNHRGFDIANHFQEWRYDYTNPEYPFYYELEENIATLEQKEIFIKQYLKHYALNTTEERHAAPPAVDEVNQLLHEVEAFALASHLFWSLWSFVNASKSQIPFGYWEYGYGRFHIYKRLKQQAIKENSGKSLKRKIHEVDI